MKQKIVVVASVLLLTFGFAASGFGQWVQTNAPNSNVRCFHTNSTGIFAGTYQGILFSSDNGASWVPRNDGLGNRSVQAISADGENLYVGTFGNGVYLSRDNGITWSESNDGLGSNDVYALTVTDTTVYAGTNKGVFISANKGRTWYSLNDGLSNPFINTFCQIGKDTYAGTGSGLFVNRANTINWIALNSSYRYNIISLLADSNYIYIGTDNEGIFRSTDRGQNWESNNTGLKSFKPFNYPPDINSLIVIGSYLFIGSYQDGIFLSTNKGSNWKAADEGLTDSSFVVMCATTSYIFGGTGNSGIWRRPLSDFGINDVHSPTVSNTKLQSFPNPLSSKTTISFSNEQREFISVSIVDILGKECAKLFSGELDSGNHSYQWDASNFPPGMYLCLLRENGITKEIPVMVMR